MAARSPSSYSTAQITLHWTIAVLIAAQFLFAESMEQAWRAWRRGGAEADQVSSGATVHVVFGLAVLVLAVLRVGIRLKRGAPPVPEDHPALVRLLANLTHFALYLFLFLMPISGAAAWFGGIGGAAFVHVMAKNVLLAFLGLHVVGAVAEFVVFGSNSFQRMVGIAPVR